MNMSNNSQLSNVRQTISAIIQISIPVFYSLRTKIRVSCIDNATKQQFANLKSLKVINMGRNIDGLFNEYKTGLIQTVYNTTG